MNKIFKVVLLDPQYKLCNYEDQPPIAEFENFTDASKFCWEHWNKTQEPVAVLHEPTQCFQEYYRPNRDALGRFQ